VFGHQVIKKDTDGTWMLPLGRSTRIPCVDIDEYGLWVMALIENTAVQEDGRPILTAGKWASLDDIVKAIERSA
jgi:hypothetical protein